MSKISSKPSLRLTVIGIALALAAGGAFADKPSWVGEGKRKEEKNRHEEKGRSDLRRDDGRNGGSVEFRFSSDDRRIVSEYYGIQVRKGKCPPGLAKKNNGCQPPGQAKKWQRGYPLARDIRYYELPGELRARLPVLSPNYRYVQVAGDVLIIAVGTSMVVDAIEDILR